MALLPPIDKIDADAFTLLVCELACDGMPNDHIANILKTGVNKVEAALRGVRASGHRLERPALNMDRMHKLFGIGAVVSANLRRMTEFYEGHKHPQPAIVAARRVGAAMGRSDGWVKAIAGWHRKAISEARAELGGTGSTTETNSAAVV